jgi:hypothetical protein
MLQDWARALTLARLAAAGRWAWSNRTPILAVLVVLLAALYFRSCGRASRSEAARAAADARATQEALVRQANVPVIEQVPQPAVDAEAQRILDEYPQLRAERDRLTKQVGKLQAALALKGQTETVRASAPERPGEAPQADPKLPRVLLREGDGLRFDLEAVGVETEKGAQALLLTIGARRAADDQELGRGPLSVPLTRAYAPDPTPCAASAPERAWRLGPAGGGAGGAGGGGWLVGLAGTYRLDLWGWRPETFLAGGAGTGGAAALAGILF